MSRATAARDASEAEAVPTRVLSGNSRGSIRASKGSGEFELATVVPYQGKPHVTFYVDGQNGGGVYFGKGASLKK